MSDADYETRPVGSQLRKVSVPAARAYHLTRVKNDLAHLAYNTLNLSLPRPPQLRSEVACPDPNGVQAGHRRNLPNRIYGLYVLAQRDAQNLLVCESAVFLRSSVHAEVVGLYEGALVAYPIGHELTCLDESLSVCPTPHARHHYTQRAPIQHPPTSVQIALRAHRYYRWCIPHECRSHYVFCLFIAYGAVLGIYQYEIKPCSPDQLGNERRGE